MCRKPHCGRFGLRLPTRAIGLILAIAALALTVDARAQAACESGDAEIFEIAGSVLLQRAGSTAWAQAERGDRLCVGDAIRTGEFARAALRLSDGTVKRLSGNAILRCIPTEDGDRSIWELLRGMLHIISRDPRSLEYTTPYANAGLRGTEFQIAVDDAMTAVSVIEGSVAMTTPVDEVAIAAGQRGVARLGLGTAIDAIPDVRDLVAWTLYFAPLTDAALPGPDEQPAAGQAADARFFAGRAARRLALGRVDAAVEDLERARSLDAAEPLLLALERLLSARFDRQPSPIPSLDQVQTIDAADLPVLIASLAGWRSLEDIEAARELLAAVAAAFPGSALAWAKLAEIELESGAVPAAIAAAERALAIDPSVSLAHSVIGFARLRNLQFADALSAFETAIAADQSDPFPHLGLGITRIRMGQRLEGRRELEIAVLLNPDDPIVRSYVGKAYYDERRGALAGLLFELAQGFAPDEPTPYLYDSFRAQASNRPVEAHLSLDKADELSGGDGASRSRLYLDEDLGVRSAPIGPIYTDLGFEQLGLLRGWQSVGRSAQDFSGHRVLADTYVSLPRHQIARVNELYKMQLLQPLSATALPPQLAEPNLFILDSVGPSDLAISEFSELYAGNDWTVQGAGVRGSNDTRGAYATLSGIHDRFSFSLGGFDFETEGFRENNDLDINLSNAFLQFRPNAKTSWLGEWRSTRTQSGDLQLLFDPDQFIRDLRQSDEVDVVRLGLSHELNERHRLLASAHFQDAELSAEFGSSFSIRSALDSVALDLQSLLSLGRMELVSGINAHREDGSEFSEAHSVLPVPPFEIDVASVEQRDTSFYSAYSYGTLSVTEALRLTLGASLEQLDFDRSSERRINPKLGLSWEPRPGWLLRAALFRTLQAPFVSKQVIQPRLEPTEIAGFNQFFFGAAGDEAARFGVGLDRRLSAQLYFGAEASRREIERSVIMVNPDLSQSLLPVTIDEESVRLYAYWLPTRTLALSAAFEADLFDNNGQVLAEDFARLKTRRLPLALKFFHDSGFSLGLRLSRVWQSGRFGAENFGPGGIENFLIDGEDSFSIVDTSLQYRLPGRRGLLSLNVRNLLDEKFRFQDLDPENPRIMPERFAYMRLTLSF